MTDYNELVEALEEIADLPDTDTSRGSDNSYWHGLEAAAALAKPVLPLARQLIEEREYDKALIATLNNRLSEACEENERLRPALGAVNKQNEALQARLSAAEEDARAVQTELDIADDNNEAMEARLSAAEKDRDNALEAEKKVLRLFADKLKRAEEVVEAVRDSGCYRCNRNFIEPPARVPCPACSPVRDAIRRWGEGEVTDYSKLTEALDALPLARQLTERLEQLGQENARNVHARIDCRNERDRLREENEQLKAEKAVYEEWMAKYADLQARLSAVEEELATALEWDKVAAKREQALRVKLERAEAVVEAMQHIAENGSGGPVLDWPTFAAEVMAEYRQYGEGNK